MPREPQIPLFRLSEPRGQSSYGTADVWQRSDMVVALLHGKGCQHCQEVLRELSLRAEGLHRDQVEVIALSSEEIPEAEGVHVLTDGDGHVEEKIWTTLELPKQTSLLIVSDRYGRVFSAEEIHQGSPAEVVESALEWVDYAQSLCEECGAPVDWA